MMNGVGMGDAHVKRATLIKRLTNQGYNLQIQAINNLKNYLRIERAEQVERMMEYERLKREKERILKRIMDSNLRMCGVGFRQSFQFMEADREKERTLMNKQRGILKSMLDANYRLMRSGYNKLIEEAKARKEMLLNKLKFVIKSLSDKDSGMILSAYNEMKQRYLMLNGVGFGDEQMKKSQLIKRLMNKGHNLQVMAVNSLKEYLKNERYEQENIIERLFREKKEKERILKRIMDSNIRMLAIGFRQSF